MKEHHEEFHPKIQKIYYHCREKSDKRFQKCDTLSTDSLTLIKYHYKIEHSKPFHPFECSNCDESFDIKEVFTWGPSNVTEVTITPQLTSLFTHTDTRSSRSEIFIYLCFTLYQRGY